MTTHNNDQHNLDDQLGHEEQLEVLKQEEPQHLLNYSYDPNPKAQAHEERKKKNTRVALIAIALIALLIIPLTCAGAGMLAFRVAGESIASIGESSSGPSGEGSYSLEDELDWGDPEAEDNTLSVRVARETLPSVVQVVVQKESYNPYGRGPGISEGGGSGVVIDNNGHIITNAHVVSGGTSFKVNTGSKRLDAVLVGADPSSDIAVLKVEPEGLKPIKIGSTKNLQVGQYVMALGSPFGLENSVTTGIISGLGRSSSLYDGNQLSAYVNLIQMDAAINPGNSGGALVNSRAELIGINTLIRSTTQSSAGVGFAIPVDSAMNIAKQLIEKGTATHPFLGVATQTINSQVASMFSLDVDSGAYVVNVVQGSPAAAAGIKQDDIIFEISGMKIENTEDVFSAVRSHSVGDEITIRYYRQGEEHETKATLGVDQKAPETQNWFHESQ